jgi:hypothetical protein
VGAFNALEVDEVSGGRKWVADHLDMENSMDLMRDQEYALCLVPFRSGTLNLVVTASAFVAFAEKQGWSQVCGSAKNQLAFKALLYQSGHCTKEELLRFRNLLQALLMAFRSTSSADGCHRQGRLRAMPSGFFTGPPQDVKVVSKPLKIGYCEALYLRNALGRAKFNMVLRAHGLLGSGDFAQTKSPLEPDWACYGVPQAGKYAAEPCCEKEGCTSYTCMVGVFLEKHPFRGMFLCTTCFRRLECREAAILQARKDSGELDMEGQERLALLLQRKEDKRDHAKRKRQADIEQYGYNAVNQKKLAEDQKREDDEAKARAEDPKKAVAYRKKAKAKFQKRRANGAPCKLPGKKKRACKSKKQKEFPIYFKKKLADGIELYIKTKGRTHIQWTETVQLFDAFVVKEKDRLKEYGIKVEIGEDGRPTKYNDLEYHAAARTVMEEPLPMVVDGETYQRAKVWPVLNYTLTDEQSAAAKKRGISIENTVEGGLIQYVVRMVYHESTELDRTFGNNGT